MAEKRQVSQRPQNRQPARPYQPYGNQGVPYTPPARQGNPYQQGGYPGNLRNDPAPVQPTAPMEPAPQPPPEMKEKPKKEPLQDSNVSPAPAAPAVDTGGNLRPDMTISDWILTFIVVGIPIVGIVVLFVWALGDAGAHPSRKTYAQAALIIFAVVFVLYLILGAVLVSSIQSALRLMTYY